MKTNAKTAKDIRIVFQRVEIALPEDYYVTRLSNQAVGYGRRRSNRVIGSGALLTEKTIVNLVSVS